MDDDDDTDEHALAADRAHLLAMSAAEARLHRLEQRERLAARRWGTDPQAALTRLARAFPSLRGAPIDPFDRAALLAYAHRSDLDDATRHAVAFVLSLAGGDHLRFDAIAAVLAWDDADADAFRAWCEAPFTVASL